MLTLTRRLGESIIIGDDIVVTLVEIDRGRVKLGITAPLDVPVDREEVRVRKERGEWHARGTADANATNDGDGQRGR